VGLGNIRILDSSGHDHPAETLAFAPAIAGGHSNCIAWSGRPLAQWSGSGSALKQGSQSHPLSNIKAAVDINQLSHPPG
jgi:hypothetical protein